MASWSAIARRIRVPSGFVFTALYLWLANPSAGSLMFGSVFIFTGLLIRALASGYLQKNEQLTMVGPYAYTRNPLYLGSLILAMGFVIAGQSAWVAIILLIMFVAVYLPVIRAEEAVLAERFPEFSEYSQRVPRFIPRLRSGEAGGSFSWSLYWKHREYNATLGSVSVMVALVLKMHISR